MNTYHINDNCKVTGPFAEEQLINLWKAGQVTANAMVRLEGTEEWVHIQDELATLDSLSGKRRRSAGAVSSGAMEMAMAPQSNLSATVAVVLTLLITGTGHFYAGEVLRGLVFLLVQCVAFYLGAWPLILLVWVGAVIDVMHVVKKGAK